MLKIRRPPGRLIFNMWIAIPGKTVFLIETAPCALSIIRNLQKKNACINFLNVHAACWRINAHQAPKSVNYIQRDIQKHHKCRDFPHQSILIVSINNLVQFLVQVLNDQFPLCLVLNVIQMPILYLVVWTLVRTEKSITTVVKSVQTTELENVMKYYTLLPASIFWNILIHSMLTH